MSNSGQFLSKRKLMLLGKFAAAYLYFFAVFWITSIYMESNTLLKPLSWPINAFLFEPIVLLIHFIILSLFTKRIGPSMVLVTVMYVLFMFINAEMVKVFGLIFSPIDIKHSIQLIFAKEALISYWKELLLACVLTVISLYFFFKSKPNQWINSHYKKIVSVTLLLLVMITLNKTHIAYGIKKGFKMSGQAVPKTFSEYHGFLFSIYYRGMKYKNIKAPEGYSKEAIEAIAKKYQSPQHVSDKVKPDVIIFFIEAFADPYEVGIKTSRDPIPNFRKYANESLSGLVISPEMGGRSANPEFELLTGLSMKFVPEKSIPYIDYIHHPYPSIAREFKSNGYQTNAVHVASLSFFNYKKAYPLLGFDYVETLHDQEGVALDPAGRFPSETALVDRIINITESRDEPQFIFSFPNSTHGFWGYKAYKNSDLDVYGDFIEDGHHQLKTYINAIHEADKAIKKLIEHYKKTEEPAVILVLGDHQPSLPEFRQKYVSEYDNKTNGNIDFSTRKNLKRSFAHSALLNDEDIRRKSHQVPYFIWISNDKQNVNDNTSMNFLPVQLMKKAGIQTSLLYVMLLELKLKVLEFGKGSPVDPKYKQNIDDYYMFQYDTMYGEQYYYTEGEGKK